MIYPLQVIDFFHKLELAIRGLEEVTIESVRNLNSMSDTVMDSFVSVIEGINELFAKYDAPNLC